MMEKIKTPLAEATVCWRSADQGGRRSGPPTAPVYMATSVFVLGGEEQVYPNWPASAEILSILIQKTAELDSGCWRCLIGFLVPDLARPYIHPNAEILVLEGPKVVASANVVSVLDEN